MSTNYGGIQWVVQRNLTSKDDFDGLEKACNKIGVDFIGIDIIPFTSELPDFNTLRHSIIYGSTTFNGLAYARADLRKGIFFDDASFSMENYIKKWGRHMLNYDSIVTTFKEIMEESSFSPDKILFIRPNDDSKSFAGEVRRFDEIMEWYNKLTVAGNTNLSLDSKIIVSEPYNIKYEWRLWIVNKKVVAASKYREYFKLKKEPNCPDGVISFAENRCLEYTPHDVFVMDICLCGDEYYIVECGCMNGAGFYKADIENITKEVTAYFYKTVKEGK
jgi:hypothetical protein